jgi:hypothetical protein
MNVSGVPGFPRVDKLKNRFHSGKRHLGAAFCSERKRRNIYGINGYPMWDIHQVCFGMVIW